MHETAKTWDGDWLRFQSVILSYILRQERVCSFEFNLIFSSTGKLAKHNSFDLDVVVTDFQAVSSCREGWVLIRFINISISV